MKTETAVIRTKNIYPYSRKICGLYPLERNIKILEKSGIKRIYLDLSVEEKVFYEEKIARRLKKITAKIIEHYDGEKDKGKIIVFSNQFLKPNHIDSLNSYYAETGGIWSPVFNNDSFLLNESADYKKGALVLKNDILAATGGYIARHINKKVSLPISLFICGWRIHPNVLTVFNMLIGIMSSVFIFMAAGQGDPSVMYMYMFLGGVFFQACSILDGVDGEVAKLTLTVSKIGGWLDTLSDNMTLLLFLVSASYLNYTLSGGLYSAVPIAIMFTGLVIIVGLMVSYLASHGEGSGSLVTYDKLFLMKMPQSDIMVRVIHSLKYITKKELFSYAFLIAGIIGKVHWVIPGSALVLIVATILVATVHFRYIGQAEELKRN